MARCATRSTKRSPACGAAGSPALLSTARSPSRCSCSAASCSSTSNLERLGDEWSRAAEMSVYLHDDVDRRRARGDRALLAPGPAGRRRSSSCRRPRRSTRFKQTFADLASTVDALGEQPAAGVLRSALAAAARASAASTTLAATLRHDAGRRRRALRPPVARPAAVGDRGIVRLVGLVLAAS